MIAKISQYLKKFKYRLLIFLAILGPGIITAVADNDAGGVATYTVAASLFGMASRFLIIPEAILLAVTQDVGARIAIVTRKGLGSLIRERYGVAISMFIFALYFITNQGVVLQNVSGLKSAFQLFNLPWQLFLILTCIFLILIVIKFNYKKLQNIFLFMILFYFAYVVSAVLSRPNWGDAMRESFVWPKNINVGDFKFWFSRIAVLGTTITAWGQFFISSFILDKNLTPSHLKAEKTEIFLGAIVTSFFSLMMAVAVTYTLFVNNIKVSDGYSAALAMTPLAGKLSTLLFSFGLLGASILGLTIVPLATAYVFSEMFGFEGSLDANFKKGRLFYSFFIIQIVISLIISLFPHTSLFQLTLYADFLNGAMLPIIFFFLIRFSGDEEIMGKYRVAGFSRFVIVASAIIITGAVLITFLGKIFNFS
ncbi:MAG: Natural resistance-associated macrophage protein [Candidatus Roizmanbacteria bacterium GW2011_GWC2_37_13]|uniref:Natural resistance-associated macrophage protein n=1 Tax=Candidatus Roizmanbacteria bacterium GW2011_GWC2_37_13 TaxID=1618486 RepID=A0A0G0JET8_9BACT|nr:MAG: natural resistance-associated macrophage protein [Candidatus Roizmanbacteria bacterium GW2011_GWC1_37_12]KKQ26681.1 MAG: Natural resistance-associated macrophage protein [Candidatus Roizmanbacteria bacterium GW2011_GWC2_37_13]